MQSTAEIEKTLVNEKQHQIALIKESILNELRQSVLENTLLTPDIQTALLLELVKISLSTYIDEKLAFENISSPAPDEGEVSKFTQTTTTTTSPDLKESASDIDLSPIPVNDSDRVEPHSRSSSNQDKLSLNLEKKPLKDLSSKEEMLKNKVSHKEQNSSGNKIVLTKSSGSLHESSKTQLSPHRKGSESPIWFFNGSESHESPKRKRSFPGAHSGRKKSPTSAFFELLSLNKETIQQYLSLTKSYLKMKDSRIFVLTDSERPYLHLVVTPHRNMESKTESQTKTVILVDRQNIEGEGANKVITGYDLINKHLLAVKIFNRSVTETMREIEIANLIKRGWYYTSYQIDDGEFAVIMKLISGDTLLQTLYVTDDTVSKQDIYANYCPKKKELDFNLQLQLILNLMKEVLKLHEKYKLLHRDLKPENIKVYEKNGEIRIRIIDFGDAVPIDSKIKELCGTDGYTDPEVCDLENQKPYQCEHDYFSLGVIIAEILTTKNYQKAVREIKAAVAHEIVTPRISPAQIQKAMDDVFKPEAGDDQYDSVTAHQLNMQNFMLLELKKLAKKMIITRLRNSSLDEEIHRIEAIEKDCRKFAKNMERFCDVKKQVNTSLDNMNRKFNAGFFLPQKEFKVESAQEATDCFKIMHSSIAEDDFKLYL